jgi:hypothetical protein
VPRRFEMTPLILIAVGGKPETIGTTLNTLRRKFIKKVLEDATLRTLVDRNGIRYDGLVTPQGEQGVICWARRACGSRSPTCSIRANSKPTDRTRLHTANAVRERAPKRSLGKSNRRHAPSDGA